MSKHESKWNVRSRLYKIVSKILWTSRFLKHHVNTKYAFLKHFIICDCTLQHWQIKFVQKYSENEVFLLQKKGDVIL